MKVEVSSNILCAFMDALAVLLPDNETLDIYSTPGYIIDVMNDESLPIAVRDTAAYALGAIKYPKALRALRKHMDRGDNLGVCAREAYEKIKNSMDAQHALGPAQDVALHACKKCEEEYDPNRCSSDHPCGWFIVRVALGIADKDAAKIMEEIDNQGEEGEER